jgi:hypothetical protein
VRPRVLLIAAPIALALAVPSRAAAAGATSNPFSPALPVSPAPTPTAPTPTVVPTTTSTAGGSLGGAGLAAIAIGALVLLGGISFFIWHDARKRAPVRHRVAAAAGESGRAGSKTRTKPRKLSPAERRRRKRGRAR